MAKVNNPWLRGVQGKVAGMVVQGGTTRGTTIIRERVDPHDADTNAQRVQRVIMATAGVAYGNMADICDHSFEGYSGKSANMNRFRSLNANMLRQTVARQAAGGVDFASMYDFTPLKSNWLVTNKYILSEGSLPRIPFTMTEGAGGKISVATGISTQGVASGSHLTYSEVVNGVNSTGGLGELGMKVGDQITICGMRQGSRVYNSITDEYGGIENNAIFSYCRLILKGRVDAAYAFTFQGEGTALVGAFEADGANILTELNGWSVRLKARDGQFDLEFVAPLTGDWETRGLVGGCAILSRKVNDKWLRSPSEMYVYRPLNLPDSMFFPLSAAISKSFVNINMESDLYLNNAQG